VIIDFHAEATSEKMVFGMYMDGKVSAVVGTHTHVQTADARILKNGTAYITDVGMCGVRDSAIGLDYETVLEKFKKLIPYPLKIAEGTAKMDFVIIDIDKNGRAEEIKNYTYVEREDSKRD
jgi:calcineurin-like phosphoesterase